MGYPVQAGTKVVKNGTISKQNSLLCGMQDVMAKCKRLQLRLDVATGIKMAITYRRICYYTKKDKYGCGYIF